MRCAALLCLAAALAMAGERPVRSVHYAVSWSDAVEEAQTLNLPIVVHRHGFY